MFLVDDYQRLHVMQVIYLGYSTYYRHEKDTCTL